MSSLPLGALWLLGILTGCPARFVQLQLRKLPTHFLLLWGQTTDIVVIGKTRALRRSWKLVELILVMVPNLEESGKRYPQSISRPSAAEIGHRGRNRLYSVTNRGQHGNAALDRCLDTQH